MNWIANGERNTSYYHVVANGRKKENWIHKIQVGDVDFFSQAEIEDEARKYYSHLYTEDQSWRPKVDNLNFPSISEEQRITMERPIEEEEILGVIKGLKQNKSPGPDGMPNEFYKATWDIIERDFMAVVKEFQNGGRLDWHLNCTFICLIPKKPGASSFKDFRPISLIGGVYKIITKALANRLKVLIPDITSHCQSAFVKDKQILDSVLVMSA